MMLAVAIFAMGMAFKSSRHQPSEKVAQSQGQNTKQPDGEGSALGNWLTQDAVGFFTAALVIVGLLQIGVFLRQLQLMRDGLKPAQEAAEAAKLNAQAVMDAEGAQLYPVIKSHNLKDVFGLRFHVYELTITSKLEPPKVVYSFKNYGKTPAKLQRVMHSITFFEEGSPRSELTHLEADRALEVIGGGNVSAPIEIEMLANFTRDMGKLVETNRGHLILSGYAIFTDFFDRQFICEWRCEGRSNGFQLISHQQHLDPDKKRA